MSSPGPSLESLREHSSVVSVPLRVPFRGVFEREVMLLRGSQRVGEWAAFPEYPDDVAARWLAAALEQACDPRASDTAQNRGTVAVNATFPALERSQIPGWWRRFPGVKSVKIKVAESKDSLDKDFAHLEALRETIGADVRLRLDANARWSIDEAEEAITQLATFSIDYVEQPVATLSQMVELKGRLHGSGIRLAADELIREALGVDDIIREQAADIAVLKVSPLGGIEPTLQLARQAHVAGLDVVLSSALETSVGLSWGIRAANLLRNELGALPDSGLGTAEFFTQDIVQDPFHVAKGEVPVREPRIDSRQLEKLAASPNRTRWWHERLARCLPRAVEILQTRLV